MFLINKKQAHIQLKKKVKCTFKIFRTHVLFNISIEIALNYQYKLIDQYCILLIILCLKKSNTKIATILGNIYILNVLNNVLSLSFLVGVT